MTVRTRALRFAMIVAPCAAPQLAAHLPLPAPIVRWIMGPSVHGAVISEGGGMSCARPPAATPTQPASGDGDGSALQTSRGGPQSVPSAPPAPNRPTSIEAHDPPEDAHDALRSWLSAHIPPGGKVVEEENAVSVIHRVRRGDSVAKVAAAYIDLTNAYAEAELADAILRANPGIRRRGLHEGLEIRIPDLVTEPQGPQAPRLGWPEERALRGVYANSTVALPANLVPTLDKLASRGLNAIVIDAKDVTGLFNYPTKIPLALETRAAGHAFIPSLSRLVRAAHVRGIRVIMRVACFRDEHLGPRRGDLAVQARGGGPHHAPSKIVDWLDPANDDVQKYALDTVTETLDAGIDEIQLDYVRYPTDGIWDADFKLKERGLTTTGVITEFVRRIHEKTHAAGVPLSLDIFGVVAWRDPRDIAATGQDVEKLGVEVEALSPMVYPSHFAEGFNGYAAPGDHPDIVAMGTRRALEELKKAGSTAVVRPWVQAFPWHTSAFGAPYIAEQLKQAAIGGGVGWLAWNSGGEYGPTWAAVPPRRADSHVSAGAPIGPTTSSVGNHLGMMGARDTGTALATADLGKRR